MQSDQPRHTTKPKRMKKKPLLWKSFPESGACVDLSFFTESDIGNGPLLERQNNQAPLSVSTEKRFWKVLPKSEPQINLSFITESLIEVPDNQREENIQGESLRTNLNLPQCVEDKSEATCTCHEKFKEKEFEYIKMQKYLMRQLDDMFGINRQLSLKLRSQKDLMRKGVPESHLRKNSVSGKVQTDSPERPQQKTVRYRSVSVQTEMDQEDTSHHLNPDRQTISTHTESDVLESSFRLDAVHQTLDLETGDKEDYSEDKKKLSRKARWRQKRKAAIKAASELKNINEVNVSAKYGEEATPPETKEDETPGVTTNIYITDVMISCPQKMSEEPVISDRETAKNVNICAEITEEDVLIPETVNDQTTTIMIEIFKTETPTVTPELVTEDEIPEMEQSGDQQEEENGGTSTPDSETKPEIVEMVYKQIETQLFSDPEDITGEVPVVPTEGESDLKEEERTPPRQMKEDEIITSSQESEPEAAEESADQKKTADQEESPRKRISLWRRIKKALTPTSRRQFKDGR